MTRSLHRGESRFAESVPPVVARTIGPRPAVPHRCGDGQTVFGLHLRTHESMVLGTTQSKMTGLSQPEDEQDASRYLGVEVLLMANHTGTVDMYVLQRPSLPEPYKTSADENSRPRALGRERCTGRTSTIWSTSYTRISSLGRRVLAERRQALFFAEMKCKRAVIWTLRQPYRPAQDHIARGTPGPETPKWSSPVL